MSWLLWTEPTGWILHQLCKGFIRLVACVGSGDPVRVLCLYTMNTLDEVCSIYCWDICTTCRYRSTCYSTGASGPTALSVCSRLCLVANCWLLNAAPILYCTVPFIATCVDAIGTVFWDRPRVCTLQYFQIRFRFLYSLCNVPHHIQVLGTYWLMQSHLSNWLIVTIKGLSSLTWGPPISYKVVGKPDSTWNAS